LQIILSALLIITLFAFIYMINSRKKQLKIQKMNAEISAKNKVIKESLSEKETLLREIHHRVNNNLQMISGILALQQMYNTDDSIRLILQEGQARIQSIALIHKALYHSDNFARVSFESYLNELVTAIQKTYQNEAKTIHCIVDAGQIELNINTAIPLSLIINEIITNSFKHAFKNRSEGRIVIRLSKLNNHYKLSISDNGIGLPDHFDPMNLHSIGFDLIMGLTKQLDGELTWQNRNGTQINITFNEITSQS
ncbi:MAG: sensor histidine kinase, partial [Flavobacterium sp.]|nr:sensor histidine kinase [Flavobacterium sp.]